MDSKPHWHILGAGAIGSVMACALQSAGHTVTLILREASYDANKNNGALNLSMTSVGGSKEHFAFPITSSAKIAGGTQSITHLLVTTKSYDVCNAVESVAPGLQAQCHVLLLTNGMGLAEQIQANHPDLTVFCGTTTEGAYRTTSSAVVHAGRGETRIGGISSNTQPGWFNGWTQAIENCRWDTHIEAALWAKLAINCVINPLTALNNCHNGELAQQPDLVAQVDQLCNEIRQVSYAAGFTETAQTLHETVHAVILGTAKNKSSMLADVSAGRPTEIADITGFLLKQARRYGIPTPHNEQLMKRITEL
ncbi:MAG: 2-dehydropantoate 2-reductase [Halioglobus sp.]